MRVFNVRNAHEALPVLLDALSREGVERESRNGPVVKFPEPVTIVYAEPTERVVFWAARDANPFFHFFESLWMLDGGNDVERLAHFVNRMRSFSDDGVTFHGAYGYRWRHHFGQDQLNSIIAALKANPEDRRQVLSMWDARADLGRVGKDLPCNLQAIFQVNDNGALDMMVTNRSNDLIWGALGANAVHFSYLHEFVAQAIGREVGFYRQVSANLHAYKATLTAPIQAISEAFGDPLVPKLLREMVDPYRTGMVEPYPLMVTDHYESWQSDLRMFLEEGPVVGINNPFFRKVAAPMVLAHAVYKNGKGDERYERALNHLEQVRATDWRVAGEEWVHRRWKAFRDRREKAHDDGPRYDV